SLPVLFAWTPNHAECIEGRDPIGRKFLAPLAPRIDPRSERKPVVGDEGEGDAKIAVGFAVGAGGGKATFPFIVVGVPDHVERIKGRDSLGRECASLTLRTS